MGEEATGLIVDHFLFRPFSMMKSVRFTLLIVLVLVVGACGTTSSSSESQSRSGPITQAEIDGSGLVFSDAHEVVRQFRPQWLVKRGTVTIRPGSGGQLIDFVAIYVDDIFQGEPEMLRQVTAQSIREIQHYNAAQAQRLGPRGHPHGAIVVRTKTR